MTERPEPPPQPDERTALESFLDYFRATLRWKAEGLSDQQARTASVDLTDVFDLGKPGRYRVEPRIHLHDVMTGTQASLPRPRAQHGRDSD